MSDHSTTNRLAAALAYCGILEKEQRQKQATKEQELQAKKRQLEVVNEHKLQERPKPRLREKAVPILDYVYLIKASNGYCKIGISHNPDKRFKILQREAAVWAITLELVHVITSNRAYILEQSFHKRFAGQRVTGEWFLLTPRDIEWLRAQ